MKKLKQNQFYTKVS